ncbi:EpsG family protein [Gordonibacter pamelaeae]|uniref:EpsG family protein n=2 Tax=Gordonibacter pamelaeae TaxID=471189 RepID=A0A369LY99_9ACTN|nr:EpsG family protein [Gordonibacter pamelaeae]RDB64114.1 hypothetical protein C1877_10350 [Gordonibacter pamelaeae]
MYVLLINAALIAIYGPIVSSKSKKVCVTLIGIQLFLLLALRAESYGPDAEIYAAGYRYISSLTFSQMLGALNPNILDNANLIYLYDFENGWVVLNWLLASLGFSYQGLIVFLAAVTSFSFCFFSLRYSDTPWFTLFILSTMNFLWYSISILRQMLALSIFLFGIIYIVKRKPIKFMLVILLAMMFHRAVILAALLYPLSRTKMTKRKLTYIFIAFVVLCALSAFVLPEVLKMILGVFGKEGLALSFSWNSLITLHIVIVVAILLLFDVDKMTEEFNANLSLCGVAASLLFCSVSLNNEVLARADEYLWIFVSLLIPVCLRQADPRLAVLGKMGAICLLLPFLAYQIYGTTLDPYISIFGPIF